MWTEMTYTTSPKEAKGRGEVKPKAVPAPLTPQAWPDTAVDLRAFEQAKAELGTTDASRLLMRAQEIKDKMKIAEAL